MTFSCMLIMNRILGFIWECGFFDNSKLVLSTHPKTRDSGNKLVMSVTLGLCDFCALTLPSDHVGWQLL